MKYVADQISFCQWLECTEHSNRLIIPLTFEGCDQEISAGGAYNQMNQRHSVSHGTEIIG